jgi:hypothetical protein
MMVPVAGIEPAAPRLQIPKLGDAPIELHAVGEMFVLKRQMTLRFHPFMVFHGIAAVGVKRWT